MVEESGGSRGAEGVGMRVGVRVGLDVRCAMWALTPDP